MTILRILLVAWLALPPGVSGQDAAPAGYPEIAILQLKLVEGEGTVHVAGARSPAPLTIQVTDETGSPVEGVTVSFRLPTDGATGVFQNGLPTDVLITGRDGRASVSGIRWGETSGPVRIRVTAVRGNVRAGIIAEQYISIPQEMSKPGRDSKRPATSKPKGRWVAIAMVAAGAAAGGLVLGVSGKSTNAPAAATVAEQVDAVQVGPPAIRVGPR